MKKVMCITLNEEIFNYFKANHLKASEIINEILKEKFQKEIYK